MFLVSMNMLWSPSATPVYKFFLKRLHQRGPPPPEKRIDAVIDLVRKKENPALAPDVVAPASAIAPVCDIIASNDEDQGRFHEQLACIEEEHDTGDESAGELRLEMIDIATKQLVVRSRSLKMRYQGSLRGSQLERQILDTASWKPYSTRKGTYLDEKMESL
jgi:hypothetical protein